MAGMICGGCRKEALFGCGGPELSVMGAGRAQGGPTVAAPRKSAADFPASTGKLISRALTRRGHEVQCGPVAVWVNSWDFR